MKPDDLKRLLDSFVGVPKCDLYCRDMLDSENGDKGTYVFNEVDLTHSIHIRNSELDTDAKALAVLAHEAHHAGMNDIFETLVKTGAISRETEEMVGERAARLTYNIVLAIVAAIQGEMKTSWR